MKWQPIETAPKDTPVVVFWRGAMGGMVETASFIGGEWVCSGFAKINPTHWIPLPSKEPEKFNIH